MANAYLVEYAKSSRSTCQGCENRIEKGQLRLGSPVVFGDQGVSYKYRHWGCITEKVLHNIRNKIEQLGEEGALRGRDALSAEDKARIQRWLTEGPFEEEWDQGRQAKAGDQEYVPEGSPEEEEPPPKIKTPRKRTSKRAALKREEAGDDEADEDYSPKARRKATKKKAKA